VDTAHNSTWDARLGRPPTTKEPPVNRRNPSPPPRAFTLIEVLVVVAIIGILTTLLVLGVNVMSTNAKRQQTRATLEQCRAMYADWDAVTHIHFGPSAMPCPRNVSADVNPLAGSATAQADDATMPNRFGAAVWLSRDLMFNVRSTPANAAALGKMSPGAMMTFPSPYNVNFPNPYAPNIAAWSSTGAYQPFDFANPTTSDYGRVYLSTTTGTVTTYVFYDCIAAVPASTTGNASPASDTAHWMAAYPVMTTTASGPPMPSDDSVPLLLDGWGNPIIFVPGGQLGTGTKLNSDGSVAVNSGSMRSGSGTSAITTQASSPDGRPFFASAGPDGDFSNGDDNLYSFEK
jgi:prepilin-type N-terminal cleavage/methylation domain-containing protein